MKYKQYDYLTYEKPAIDGEMASWWSNHWGNRVELKTNLRDEPLWATIEDIVQIPGFLLEAGCGPGQWVQFFNSLGHTTIGLDYAEKTLITSKSVNPTLRLLAGDLRYLPFPDNCFDYIYCNGAIEHDEKGPETSLKEFHRVLKPSGWLMCSVPCLNVERTLAIGLMMARDWLKRQEFIRRIAGKKIPFVFYQYVFSQALYKLHLTRAGFNVLFLRPYGHRKNSWIRKTLFMISKDISDFYCPHMMMAICRKEDIY